MASMGSLSFLVPVDTWQVQVPPETGHMANRVPEAVIRAGAQITVGSRRVMSGRVRLLMACAGSTVVERRLSRVP